MAVLETIAHEIMIEILSYLPCSDLAQTARVCLKLYTVSQSLLYTAPCVTSITGVRTPPSLQVLQRTTPPPLQLFLRTLLSPGGEHLAAQARSLRLTWDNIPMDPPTNVPADVAGLFASAASRFGLNLPLASQGAQVVLLLHHLPRLRVLDLGLPIDRDAVSFFISRYHDVTPTPARPLALDQLREFRCSRSLMNGPINSTLLLVLLGMPNMRSVDVHIIDFPHHPLEAVTRSSRVTKLRFTRAVISPETLRCILATTVALTHFTYHLKCYLRDLDITHIGPALAPLRGTLQLLHFTIDKGLYVRDGRPTVTGSLGSLRDWTCLRTLRCQLVGLIGCSGQSGLVDILPAGLRELEIVEDGYWAKEEVREQVLPVLRFKTTVVPVLERLGMALSAGEEGSSGMDRLRRACEEAAVLLVNSRLGRSNVDGCF